MKFSSKFKVIIPLCKFDFMFNTLNFFFNSSFTFNGKIFQFVVNGQTGKVGGKSPVSPIKVIIAILIAIVILIILFNIFGN